MFKQTALIYLLIANAYQIAIAQRIPCPNNAYNARQDAGTSTCLIWGNYHIKTFDDHGINFKSYCTFTLVKFDVDGTEFRIDIGGFKNICLRDDTGCHTFIQIFYNNVAYKLALENGQGTFTTDQKSYPIPSDLPGLMIHQPGYRIFVEFTKIGVIVKWDEKNMVEVSVKNDGKFEMFGLCGNNDKCSSNDQMLSNRAITDLHRFLSEWQVDKQACPSTTDIDSPCRGHKTRILQATNECEIMNQQRFGEARRLIDPALYIAACIWNYCSCRTLNTMGCLCGSIDAYVKASNNAGGAMVPWRDDKTCRFQCTGSLQYFPCRPKGGVQSCTDAAAPEQGVGKCEEGCYCAPNTFFFDGKCYLKNKCPCRFGKTTYQPGDTMQQKCHPCVCTDGKFVCRTHPPCKVVATATGDPHFTTWDGKRFDFMGKCSYYLVKGNDFSIEADHHVWEGGKFVKNYNSKAPSWIRRLVMRTEGEVIEFKPNLVVNVNNVSVTRFPHRIGNTIITKPSSRHVLAELPNAVEVQWDGYSTATVRLPVELEGQIMGLLGTYTEDRSDDFMTPFGEIANDPVTFGNSWKTEFSCQDESPAEMKHPCDVNPGARPAAEKTCGAIKGDLFKQCEIDDKDTLYDNCVYDTCLCKEDPDKCSCDQIAMAADMCGQKKIVTNWRNTIPQCLLPCPAGQVYQECGNACARTCEDLSMRPDCAETCIEGCNCAPGTTMDESGQCVPVAQCKCRIDGIVYPPGFQFLKSEKELLTCVNAKWQSSTPSTDQQTQILDQNELNEKCDPYNFLVYTACKYPAPKTCQNMHIFEIIPIPVCEEGCECVEGFVLDLASQSCIRPDECSCYFNGRGHEEGSVTVQDDCKRCACNSDGFWDCTQEKCDDLCNENEVKKVDCNTCRCKGARWECTQQECCPTEGESEKVDDCNTCICTNGIWACTKKECAEKCIEKNIKEDGCRVCICEKGEWKCNEDNCLAQTCENGGQVIQTQNGKCVCSNGTWKCARAQCDIWGDSHVKTFDGLRYDFQGECSYYLAGGTVGNVEFSVTFTNERCSHAGATCLKSFTVEAKVQNLVETVTLSKKSELPASNFKNLAVTDHVLHVTVEILNAEAVIFWDKKTWVYIKLGAQWKKNVKGLCGNYNNLKEDDVESYDARSNDDSLLAFIDLWRTNQECELTRPNVNTCDEGRRKWAETTCDTLLGPTFAACHQKVPVDSYYEACVTDSCKCDLGGDCECLCTAISTYAQVCNNFGIPVNWRSQELCPIQCSRNTEYTPCMSPCPPTTCETIQRDAAFNCEEGEVLCTEGCGPKALPPGMVYKDGSYEEFVDKDACKQKRCKESFYEGEVTFKEKCRICLCMSGEERCLPLPCDNDFTTERNYVTYYTNPPPTKPDTGNQVTPRNTPPSKNGITTQEPNPTIGVASATSTSKPTPVTTPGIIWPVTTAKPPPQDCDQVICPALNCPTITSDVQVPGQCCKSCQHETKCVVKLQYNNRLVLKKPGQKWIDGPCRECECVGKENFQHCSKCRMKRCAIVNKRNVTLGNIYYEFTKGPCCTAMEAAACVYDKKLYRISEIWDIDRCRSMKCAKDPESAMPMLLESKQVCHEECALGFVYKKSENLCCGQCVQDSCIVGNIARKVGDTWESPDGCTAYRCTSDKGVYQVISRTTTCPPLPENCSGTIKKGRCCSYCDSSELFAWEEEPFDCNMDVIPPAV